MYKIITELSNDVIYEGPIDICNIILRSFKEYGVNTDKFILVAPEKWMSEYTRKLIEEILISENIDGLHGHDVRREIVAYGATFLGIENLSDDDLLIEFGAICNDVDEDPIYKTALIEQELHKLLVEK